MGLFEWRLRRKIKREIRAEQKQAQLEEAKAATERRIENNIASLEAFSERLEASIKKYRQKAVEAQKNNNVAAFNSYIAQIVNTQKMLDSNTLMMVDAIRHADSVVNNREMMHAQAAIGEIVNPKLDISQKEMLATREKYMDNAMKLTNALERDEEFSTMFEDIYTPLDSAADKSLFDKISSDLINQAAYEETAQMESDMMTTSSIGIDSLKQQIMQQRQTVNEMRNRGK